MKILLVLPAAERVRVTGSNPRVPDRAMLRFSILPLTAVAALTPEPHEVAICDENVEAIDLGADVDLVAISFMTAVANRAYDIARAFRARGVTVVAGGYHPTLCPEDAAPHFDALVRGDAEGAWPELLGDLEAGKLQPVYDHRGGSGLGGLPVPRRDLLERTAHHYVTTNAVQTGRGCRHDCKYCSIAAFHQGRYRRRPVEEVIAELEGMSREVLFVDDNIVSDPEYAAELFRAMIPLRKRWVSQCSLMIADDRELLELAHRAGCRGLFIGLETLSERNLESMAKAFNDSRGYLTRTGAIRRAGIGIVAGIIVGMDHDEPTVFESTLHFLHQARIDAVQVNILTPLPGTPLHESMKREGRIVDPDWDHYDFRHCVIEPKRMSREALQEGADWIYCSFYRLDRILLRAIRAFFSAGPLPAWLGWKLGLTYRRDLRRERVRGRNPAREHGISHHPGIRRRGVPHQPRPDRAVSQGA